MTSDPIDLAEIGGLAQEWQIPGVGVGVVQDGHVLLQQGFGLRDAANHLPMTDATVLPIGSATTSFTSLALAMLADAGEFDWDTPVCQYIPWFTLYDAAISGRVTGRDLLSHRTGVPGHDVQAAFYPGSRRQLVESLRHLQPSADLRTKLQYQNQMVAAAGYVVEAIAGCTWEQYVHDAILAPLGMDGTVFTIEALIRAADHSLGYIPGSDGPKPGEYIPLGALGPAGAINSTTADMVKYLQFQLSGRAPDGRRLVSEAALAQTRTATMIGSPYFWNFEEFQCTNYGLGWFVDVYRGHALISHGGNTRGFSSLVTLLPEQNLGIVTLSNADTNFGIYPMTYNILDRALCTGDANWSARVHAEVDRVMAGEAAMTAERAEHRVPDTRLSHPSDDYAGTYSHPAYGTIEISVDGGVFSGTYNGYPMTLAHHHYDTLDATILAMELPALLTFGTDQDGRIATISVPFETAPGVDPIVFTRED